MEYFTCNQCGVSKDLSCYYKCQKNPRGHQTKCKVCRSIQIKKNSAKPEVKANRKLWSEKYYLNNKESITKYNRSWALDNKAKFRVYWANRRAMKKNATPSWAKTELEVFLMEELYDLARRREVCLNTKFHVDHIVPLQSDLVCGLHCFANLQIITAEQNFKKNNVSWPDMPN